MLAPELKSQINKLWDRFWSGGIANPLTAIEQMSYLIFMKRLEDLDSIHTKRAAARKETHESIFDGYENCRWSQWKHLNAESMLKHVQEVVFPFIKNLTNGDDVLYAQYMKDAVFVIPKASLLQEAVAIIDEMNITERNQDTQGDIYEHLLAELKTAGKNGQFRTPRHIIRMMIELVDPDIGQTICDPASGTSGFLIAAYEHILRKYTTDDIINIHEDGSLHNLVGDKIVEKSHWNLLKRDTFYGFDFDTTMVRIGLMNMILHGIERPNIRYSDTLSKRFDQKAQYDIVFANPPFAGSIDKSDINEAFKLATAKTELLFLELFHNLLRIGGRAAVIVPDGVLSTRSRAHLTARKLLLEKCDLEAVISMPSGVFQPYSGVSTAVLVFVKGGRTENVWFYEMEADGYSLDQKREFVDGKGDIPDIIETFKHGKIESAKSFLVPFETIKRNGYTLSVSRYKRVQIQETEYEDPDVLIEKLSKLENEITGELKELKELS
ncbi:MAG: SAM-dependent DNA methyltransferase [Thaumarchaeota archaeon]|nr:SAM-dependent DNA methyltransferase [Nitrososphaerota archaeon]